MDNDVYSFALKTTLNELQNVCPDITHAFMFHEKGEILAGDKNTSEKTMGHVMNSFEGITEKAGAIGGIENLSFQGTNGTVTASHINDIYFVTVASKKADMNYVNTVTRVLIPTVLKLLDKISSTPLKNNPHHPADTELETAEEELAPKFEEPEAEFPEEPALEEPREIQSAEITPEPVLPEPPVNQLIVENLGGLLVPSDTVRIDNEMLSQWAGLYEGRKIEEVEVETFGGKKTQCKVKPIKDSKYEGKGIIQVPEKIRTDLEINKGELVRVKPIVE
jgi:hypothetical protein